MADYPRQVLARWEAYGSLRWRARKDMSNPCDECGWGPHTGIHLPAITGSRKGEPFGHAYRPYGKPPAATLRAKEPASQQQPQGTEWGA
jgi:hypothetical protein